MNWTVIIVNFNPGPPHASLEKKNVSVDCKFCGQKHRNALFYTSLSAVTLKKGLACRDVGPRLEFPGIKFIL